jgi:hypothetical protein
MGRVLLLVFFAALGLWAVRAAQTPDAMAMDRFRTTTPTPVFTSPPPGSGGAVSNRTGSTRGPIIIGGGPGSGK